MSNPHTFGPTDECIYCGISRMEMIQTKAMDSCHGNKSDTHNEPVYIEARFQPDTRKVEVWVNGKWVDLNNYYYQKHFEEHRKYLETGSKPLLITRGVLTDVSTNILGVEPEVDEHNKMVAEEEKKSRENLKNYCRTGGWMSRCTCAEDNIDQKLCRFYEPSSGGAGCMYFRDDETIHCDNVRAQIAAFGSVKSS